MSYGDDLPSSAQRGLAFAASALALLELSYCWLVAAMMATPPNPRLTAITALLTTILIGNGFLLFGIRRPARHWLRIASATSLVLLVGGPALLVFIAILADGS